MIGTILSGLIFGAIVFLGYKYIVKPMDAAEPETPTHPGVPGPAPTPK